MSEKDNAARTPFQDWLAASQSFLADGALDPRLRDKAQTLFDAWQRFGTALAEAGGATAGGAGPFDPAGWVDLAGGGGLGDLWSWFGGAGAAPGGSANALKASREWAAYGAALTRYRAVLGAAWLAAFRRFADDMTGTKAVADFPAMQQAWQQAAEQELAGAQRSETYLAAQRDLIRARLDCAKMLRAQADEIAGLLGLPTRAEVDALHQALHDMRRELRSLKGSAR